MRKSNWGQIERSVYKIGNDKLNMTKMQRKAHSHIQYSRVDNKSLNEW